VERSVKLFPQVAQAGGDSNTKPRAVTRGLVRIATV
jgi:hypothetical protein